MPTEPKLVDPDFVCSNPIFTTTEVSCSSISHISSLVPMGDEFRDVHEAFPRLQSARSRHVVV